VLPIGVGAQGFLLSQGYDAVRISGAGESTPAADQARLDPERFGALGKAVLQALSAIDEGPLLEHGPDTYVTVGTKILPLWAVSLLAVGLIIPALVASVDAAARARRRREPIGPWFVWLAHPCLAFLAGLVMALILGLLGVGADAAGSAPVAETARFDGGAVVFLLLVTGAAAGTWAALRPLGRIQALSKEGAAIPGAGVATSLALSVVALLVWLPAVGMGNPFAALVLVVPLHLWMLATLGDAPMHGRTRIILFVLGLVPAALVALYYMLELGLNPASGAWYLLLLVTGGQMGLRAALLLTLFVGIAASTLAIVITQGRGRRPDPEAPPLRGPASGELLFTSGSRR